VRLDIFLERSNNELDVDHNNIEHILCSIGAFLHYRICLPWRWGEAASLTKLLPGNLLRGMCHDTAAIGIVPHGLRRR
jgi:hypothetical protein